MRLRNLLHTARESLVSEGMRGPDADALLDEALRLGPDDECFRHLGAGLAIFVSVGETRTIVVDSAMPEEVVVGDRFLLRPLLSAYHGDDRFWALALDKNGSRLFLGNRTGVIAVPVPEAPASFAEETAYGAPEDQLQNSSFAGPESIAAGGRRVAMFHGHGGEKDVDKEMLFEYLRRLDRAIAPHLGTEGAVPMVLLGVNYETVMFREISTYPTIAASIDGTTDELTESEIHDKSLTALEPIFDAMLAEHPSELREKGGSDLVSSDPARVVAAAAVGRVKALFLDESTGPYGHLDRDSFEVTIDESAPPHLREAIPTAGAMGEPFGWDLIDLAAAETALHGGEIHAFATEDAPIHGVAAVFRY